MSEKRGFGRGRYNDNNWRGNRGKGREWNSWGNKRKTTNRRRQDASSRGEDDDRHRVNHQPRITDLLPEIPPPYKGWKLYFPDEGYVCQSSIVRHVEIFEKYLLSWKQMYRLEDVRETRQFDVDYKGLMEDEGIGPFWQEIKKVLDETPDKFLSRVGLAMHQIVSVELETRRREWFQDPEDEDANDSQIPPEQLLYLQPRLINFLPHTLFKNIKACCYGKFVSLKGTVVRVGNCKPLCSKMAFKCSNCENIQAVTQIDGKYTTPSKCGDPECRSRTFTPQQKSQLTETIDWQTIRLQELSSDDNEPGRVPRTIECELTDDLVDSCLPGDSVTVAGIVKMMSGGDGERARQRDKCVYLLYLLANSLVNSKGRCGRPRKRSLGHDLDSSLDFSIKELYLVREIQAEENLFRLLVNSLCPAIYGQEMVKAGLLLGLFGGTAKYADDENNVPVRGDPHVLVVGDPGLGKSQMLQACSSVAPRGIYVCGNSSTVAGLTVTCTKDSGSDAALEAGALVLADQGCCCIDEFDKMGNQHQALLEAMEQQSNQHQALLEAMEQQSISIAKAGVVCSLRTRASILAAANPVGGHYNRTKTVSENLKLGSALLSRFDLVFILMDCPDEEIDSKLSEYVMALHSAGGRPTVSRVSASRDATILEKSTPNISGAILEDINNKPLIERLRYGSGEVVDTIPHPLLRKYIAYARQYVHPKISTEAAESIREFYIELRKRHHSSDSTPITTRQLESLIRLTEARARIELREVCTAEDARDVIDIMKHSMIDTYADGLGQLDFQRSQLGSGASTRGQAKRFIAAVTKVAETTGNSLFTVDQLSQIAKQSRIQVPNFEDFVCSLNNQNYLLKKGPRAYKLLTTAY